MFIISLPWKHRELEYLQAKSYLFDLCMEYSPKQSYLVIQNNKVALIGMGTVEGEFSCQIRSRAFTMNGSIEKIINYGNVGFLGKYSSIGDAIHKLFPSNGYCVTNMRLTEYTGQDLKGDINHYSVID